MDSRYEPEGLEATPGLEAASCGSPIIRRSSDDQHDTLERAGPVLSLVHRGWDASSDPSPLRAVANHLCQVILRFMDLIPKMQKLATQEP